MFSTKVETTIEEEEVAMEIHQENGQFNKTVEVLHHKEIYEEETEWELVSDSSEDSQLSNQEFERQVAGADVSCRQNETNSTPTTVYKKTAQDALNDCKLLFEKS